MTREQIAAGITPEQRAEAARRYDATTEADIRRMMIEDGEDPDAEIRDEDIISPWFIRKRLGMTQEAFAVAIGVPLGTLRNWEQNRVVMEPAVVSLMRILAREPEAALRALARVAA
jgi:putative transcriptional regulator